MSMHIEFDSRYRYKSTRYSSTTAGVEREIQSSSCSINCNLEFKRARIDTRGRFRAMAVPAAAAPLTLAVLNTRIQRLRTRIPSSQHAKNGGLFVCWNSSTLVVHGETVQLPQDLSLLAQLDLPVPHYASLPAPFFNRSFGPMCCRLVCISCQLCATARLQFTDRNCLRVLPGPGATRTVRAGAYCTARRGATADWHWQSAGQSAGAMGWGTAAGQGRGAYARARKASTHICERGEGAG